MLEIVSPKALAVAGKMLVNHTAHFTTDCPRRRDALAKKYFPVSF